MPNDRRSNPGLRGPRSAPSVTLSVAIGLGLTCLLAGLVLAAAGPATPAAAAGRPHPSPTPLPFGPGLNPTTLAQVITAPIQLRVVSSTAVLILSTSLLQRVVVTDAAPLRGYTTTIRLDPARLAPLLAPLATQVRIAPRDARVALVKGTPVLQPAVPGQELDLVSAPAAIVAASFVPTRTAILTPRLITATIQTSDVQPFAAQWAAILSNGYTFYYGSHTWQIPGSVFADAVHLVPLPGVPGQPVHYRLAGMEEVLGDQLWAIAEQVNYQAHDTRFRLVNGQVLVTAHAEGGYELKRNLTLAVVHAALDTGQYWSNLIVARDLGPREIAPPAAISTPDLLAEASTTYQGSSPERAHNVELGTSLLDGALVAPGAEFDTNGTLGPLTLAAGFQMGFGIVSDGTNVTTVPAEGGGICQVATTLFHSVFWSGLPVTERHHHSYWIALYGRAPDGLQGLDATIAPPEDNFRWRNSTGNWVLVRGQAAQGVVHFALWGTNPGWRVQVGAPAISDVVATDHSPIYERTAIIPAGITRQVEHAQPGFTADIHRQVYDATGTLIDDWHVAGTYAPAHDRYMIGEGPQTHP